MKDPIIPRYVRVRVPTRERVKWRGKTYSFIRMVKHKMNVNGPIITTYIPLYISSGVENVS